MSERERAKIEREKRRQERAMKQRNQHKKRKGKTKEIENFMKEIEANKKAQSISQSFMLKGPKRGFSLNRPVRPASLPIGGIGFPPQNSGGGLYLNVPQHEADKITTNLYVGNLPSSTTEADLMREFGQYGPIGSIKIMWPRTQEEKDRNKNCGFVSFMVREHAEAALTGLAPSLIFGEPMRISWGKPVVLPPVPLRNPFDPRGTGIWPFAPPLDADGVPLNSTRVKIQVPQKAVVRKTIHLLAKRVAKDGMAFENLVIDKERDNPNFSFLFQTNQPPHFYYRWKLLSLVMGDSMAKWHEAPFQLVENGQWWIPPRPQPKLLDVRRPDSSSSDKKSSRRSKDYSEVPARPMPAKMRNKFMSMLRQLSTVRYSIREGMAFCLDRAEFAQEITEILVESLTLANTGAHKKLARLFLVSDILYNVCNNTSGVKNASRYRSEIQKSLVTIFQSFVLCLKNQTGQKKTRLRNAVHRVLDVWTEWAVFQGKLISQVRNLV